MPGKIASFLVLLLLITAGCDRLLRTADQVPLPSESEIYQTYRDALDVILVRGHPSREEATQAVDAFRQALATDLSESGWYPRRERNAYEDARTFARRHIEDEIVTQIRESRDLGGWKIVEAAILAYWVLNPDELLYSELYAHAVKMNNMPSIVNRGYVAEDDVVHVFFEIDDHVAKSRVTVQVEEGEVFYNNRFKLERIVGNHLRYEIRYLDVEDHVFEVESTRRGAPDIPSAPPL
jgi:hypothetical protein